MFCKIFFENYLLRKGVCEVARNKATQIKSYRQGGLQVRAWVRKGESRNSNQLYGENSKARVQIDTGAYTRDIYKILRGAADEVVRFAEDITPIDTANLANSYNVVSESKTGKYIKFAITNDATVGDRNAILGRSGGKYANETYYKFVDEGHKMRGGGYYEPQNLTLHIAEFADTEMDKAADEIANMLAGIIKP